MAAKFSNIVKEKMYIINQTIIFPLSVRAQHYWAILRKSVYTKLFQVHFHWIS